MQVMFKRVLAFALAVLMFALAGCVQPQPTTTSPGTTGSTAPTQGKPDDEFTLPKEEGHNQITFYWNYLGDLENCDVWVWWDGKEGSGYRMQPADVFRRGKGAGARA